MSAPLEQQLVVNGSFTSLSTGIPGPSSDALGVRVLTSPAGSGRRRVAVEGPSEVLAGLLEALRALGFRRVGHTPRRVGQYFTSALAGALRRHRLEWIEPRPGARRRGLRTKSAGSAEGVARRGEGSRGIS